MRILLPLVLTGCVPYVEYEHLSQPGVRDDGYDLLCAGVEVGEGFTASGSVCHNMHRPSWQQSPTYFKGSVRYTFRR